MERREPMRIPILEIGTGGEQHPDDGDVPGRGGDEEG